MTAGSSPPARDEIMAALGTVRDPELDEPVTDLGFVAALTVRGGWVDVALRLPTYFCAPNFAWLMIADATSAVQSIPGVTHAEVRLVDHFAADEINDGVADGQGFGETFAGLADGELDELRQVFRRKALAARQDRLCRAMLAAGITPEELARQQLADLPDCEETEKYLQRRAELGVDVSADAPLLVDTSGTAVSSEQAAFYLRRLRIIGVSVEGNAGFCRSLLATRYANVRSNA